MSVSAEMLRSWRAPQVVLRRQLAGGRREDRALVYLLLACFLIFIGQWPRLARMSAVDESVPLQARIVAALFGWLFIAPLALYALAGVSHLVARVAGGRGTHFGARMALFWSLLAVAPLWLAHGLVAGLAGSGPLLTAVGLGVLAATAAIWALCLVEAERGAGA